MSNIVAVSTDSQITEQMFDALNQQLLQLQIANAHAKREFATMLQEDLPPAAVPVLALALQHDQISQSEIAERLMVDKASLSRLVTRLEAAGFLTRTLDSEDRRVTRISATELAASRWESVMQSHQTQWKARMQDWPMEDIDQLISLLSRLNIEFRQR